MGLETVNNGKIHELVKENPDAADSVNRGDDHIRNIKKVIKETFSGINAEGADAVPVTAESAELNILDGATLTTDELNILHEATVTTDELNVLSGISEDLQAADLNILDGVTTTTDELNHVGGVTSAIQDQIDDKQDELTAGDNITINAVTENDVTTTTINASGTPFVVVGDTSGYFQGTTSNIHPATGWANIPITDIVYPSNTMSGSPAVPTGVSINASGDTLTLPEGTYYYEAWAKLYNPSSGSTNGDVRVQLRRATGEHLGYLAASYLGQWDTYDFPNQGMFTIAEGGGDIRLSAYKLTGAAIYYAQDGVSGAMQSVIKVWKL